MKKLNTYYSCIKTTIQISQKYKINTETFNLLERKIGETLKVTFIGKDFVIRIPIAQEITVRIKK